jgi:hypothetical protein
MLVAAEALGQTPDSTPSPPPAEAPVTATPTREPAPTSSVPPPIATPPAPAPGAAAIPASSPRHGGFYLKASTQLMSYFWISGDGPYGPASISDIGGPLGGFAIGGTIAPGLALAGHLGTSNGGGHFDGGPFTNATVTTPMRPGSSASASATAGMTMFELGLLVDWFPNPSGGLNFGGSFGLGELWVVNAADRSGLSGAGAAWSVSGGYAFWVGHYWSLGLDLVVRGLAPQLHLYDSSGADSGYRLTPVMIAGEWSVLYY